MKTILTHAKHCKGLWYVDINGEAAGLILSDKFSISHNGKGKPGKTDTFVEAINIIEQQFKETHE